MDSVALWGLITLQVFMGAFDTLVHHEGTERLAWRASQRDELRLHGVRNFFYVVIFLAFAWTEPHGVYTMILATILAVEVLITLWDFVEEDLTRKLPPTERINHTLLALNYGAILALAAPYLYAWSLLDSAVLPANYGWWSIMATASAIGVGLFSIRDLLAAARSDRLIRPNPGALVDILGAPKRLLITGGTGFIGTRLIEALVASGHRVTVLTRDVKNAQHLANPVRVVTGLGQIPNDERLDAIINLAGDAIAGGLWTKAKRQRIIASRVDTTRDVVDLIDRLDHTPDCLISGSAIGWYGPDADASLTEASEPKDCLTHQICAAWESEASKAAGTRVVMLRTGLVLGVEGGLLAKLLTPFEFGLGGPMGSGQQWMSWVELDDMVRIIAFAIATPPVEGALNATAPNPATNNAFADALAASLHRPALLRAPAAILRLGLGDLAQETMLTGQKVLPQKLLDAGFTFHHADLAPALRQITGAKDRDAGATETAQP